MEDFVLVGGYYIGQRLFLYLWKYPLVVLLNSVSASVSIEH
jgi:hypothetical protein